MGHLYHALGQTPRELVVGQVQAFEAGKIRQLRRNFAV